MPDQTASAPNSSHLRQLDVLRGIAIFSVLLFHCMTAVYGKAQLEWAGNWRVLDSAPATSFYLFYPYTFGWAGVSLFFVISGFVIHFSYLRGRQWSIGSFYWRRFWRIYPPYFLALAFFSWLLWRQPQLDRSEILKQFLVHALALHNLSDDTYYGITPSFWSLATEIQFYLIYPLLLALRSRVGMQRSLYAVFALGLVIRLWAYTITDWSQPVSLATWHNALVLWFDWVLGAYLAEEYCAGRRIAARPLVAGVWLLVVMVASTLYKPASVLTFSLASLLSLIIIERSLWTNREPNGWRKLMAVLGVCSYSFYLWHQPLLPIMARRLATWGVPRLTWEQMILLPLIAFPVVFALSHLLYRWVEQPSQSVGKRWTSKISNPANAR